MIGASIRAAQSSNRHIVALESDVTLFEEVLKPLQTLPSSSKTMEFDSGEGGMESDGDSPVRDVELVDLCEEVCFAAYLL